MAFYLKVRDADNVVTFVGSNSPAVEALHTIYNETPSIDISGWSGSSIVTRTGVDTYVSTPFVFQTNSFAIRQVANSKLWITRDSLSFDFSNPFTIVIPIKAKWSTGLGSGWLFDLLSTFYIYMSAGFLNIRAFDGVSNSTTSTAVTLVDDAWMWIGITYDGIGGYQFIVDDQLKANTNTRVLPSLTSIFKFGERSGFNVALDMDMGNILILSKVISANELTDYYNSGESIDAYDVFPEEDIVHYVCADNLQGNVSPDTGGVKAFRRGGVSQNGMTVITSSPS